LYFSNNLNLVIIPVYINLKNKNYIYNDMERSIINQVKSDIFKELYTIINFYVKKGAKPENLKKFYKKNKN
jgi:hypothetical protein